MSKSYSRPTVYSLPLSNGIEWHIVGKDCDSETIVSRYAECMMLNQVIDHSRSSTIRTVSVEVSNLWAERRNQVENSGTCVLPRIDEAREDADFCNFTSLSATLISDAFEIGTVFLHAALAEHENRGIVFAAPGGTGKTTASRRLPQPWISLCDDTTLVACDELGQWRVHPWPTWSDFLDNKRGGRWDVGYSVPLEAIFFLNQADTDCVERLGKGEGLSILAQSSAEAGSLSMRDYSPELKRTANLKWFSYLTELATQTPMFRLKLSLKGEFWKNVESALNKEVI